MSKTTPAFQALSLSANTSTPPAADWKHPLGRPRRPWLQQLKEDTGLSISVGPIVVEVAIRPSASQAHMIEYRLHFRRKIRNNRITDRQKDKSTYYTHMNAYRLYDSINRFLRIYVKSLFFYYNGALTSPLTSISVRLLQPLLCSLQWQD